MLAETLFPRRISAGNRRNSNRQYRGRDHKNADHRCEIAHSTLIFTGMFFKKMLSHKASPCTEYRSGAY